MSDKKWSADHEWCDDYHFLTIDDTSLLNHVITIRDGATSVSFCVVNDDIRRGIIEALSGPTKLGAKWNHDARVSEVAHLIAFGSAPVHSESPEHAMWSALADDQRTAYLAKAEAVLAAL